VHVFWDVMLRCWGSSSSTAVQEEFFFHCLTLKMKALQAFKTSGTTQPMAQYHTPENLMLKH
jgi:hypothetical protein